MSTPSLEVAGSAIIGSSMILAGPLYLNGTDIMTTIAANAGASISSTSQLSIASVTCTADIQGRDIAATRELQCDGAATPNSTLTVWGNTSMAGSLSVGGTNVITALSGKQATLSGSSAVSVATVQASTGMLVTGGRGGVSTNGAQLRVVSSNSSITAAPSIVYWGVNNEDHQCFEYNFLGFSHFWRSSAAAAWSDSVRVTTTNKWTFWSGTVVPSDARLKDDVRDLPQNECLDVLRQVSAVSYRRNDLSESTRSIGFIAQSVQAALGPSIANTNVTDTIEREVSPGTTETLNTLAYDRMAVILWQCTRSLLARVEALEARLAQ